MTAGASGSWPEPGPRFGGAGVSGSWALPPAPPQPPHGPAVKSGMVLPISQDAAGNTWLDVTAGILGRDPSLMLARTLMPVSQDERGNPQFDPTVGILSALPISKDERGRARLDFDAGVVGGLKRSLTTFARGVRGEIPSHVMDQTTGELTPNPELVEASFDLASVLGGGGLATAPARAGVGIFGGKLAKTADLAKLQRAGQMALEGKAPDEIFDATGWFRGADGQWRFEIDDSAAQLAEPIAEYGSEARTLGKAVRHDRAYEAYPDLADIPAAAQMYEGGGVGMYGAAAGAPEAIYASGTNPAELRNTVLHEMQHAVQQREGFARGGNPKSPELQAATRDIAQKAANDYADLHNDMRAFQDDWLREQGIADNDMDYTRWMALARQEWRKQFPKRAEKLDRAFRDMDARGGSFAYRRLAGEVEARNVSGRSNLGETGRRAIRPWETQDVPTDLQIVRMRPSAEAEGSILDRPLYHGSPRTDLDRASSIGAPALQPSTRGPLGPGVYTSPAEGIARSYAGAGGRVYTLPERGRDIFRGHGHREDSEWFGYVADRDRLIAAAEPDKKADVKDIVEKLWSGDGYPMYQRLIRLYGSEEKAQALFRRAGFEGVSGQVDGPEVLLFGEQRLTPATRVTGKAVVAGATGVGATAAASESRAENMEQNNPAAADAAPAVDAADMAQIRRNVQTILDKGKQRGIDRRALRESVNRYLADEGVTAEAVASFKIGRGQAALRGAADFMTGGFSDELVGLAAAGAEDPEKGAQLTDVARGAWKLFRDDPEAEQRYKDYRERAEGKIHEAYEDHPVSTIAGGVGGALAASRLNPMAARQAARTLPGRVMQGMRSGAIGGGIYGAGLAEGDLVDRGMGAVTGAMIGAPFGTAGEMLSSGLGAGARALGASVRDRLFPPAVKPTPTPRAGSGTGQANKAAADEFGIPLSQGQATQDAAQLAEEEAMKHGARGTIAYDRASNFRRVQDTAREQALQDISAGFAPSGGQPKSALDSGALLIDRVKGEAAARKAAVTDAYTTAGQLGGGVKTEGVRAVAARVRKELNAGEPVVIDTQTPRALKALQTVDDLGELRIRNDAAPGGRTVVPAGEPTTIAGVSMKGLEHVRKNLSALYRAANDPADRRGVARVIAGFDGWLDEAMDAQLFLGTDEGLAAYKRARAMHREYRQLFSKQGTGDDIGALIEKVRTKDVQPAELANWIYGVNSVGEKGLSTRAAIRFQQIFGRNSEEMTALQQGLWSRLTGLGGDARTPKGAQQLANDITAFVSGRGKGTAELVFTKEQRDAMKRFAGVLKMTVTPKELTNPSKSAYVLEREMRNVGQTLGLKEGMIRRWITTLVEWGIHNRSAVKARQAFGSRPLPVPRYPSVPSAAGRAALPAYDEYRRQQGAAP